MKQVCELLVELSMAPSIGQNPLTLVTFLVLEPLAVVYEISNI